MSTVESANRARIVFWIRASVLKPSTLDFQFSAFFKFSKHSRIRRYQLKRTADQHWRWPRRLQGSWRVEAERVPDTLADVVPPKYYLTLTGAWREFTNHDTEKVGIRRCNLTLL